VPEDVMAAPGAYATTVDAESALHHRHLAAGVPRAPTGLLVGLMLAALPEQEEDLVGLGVTLDEDVELIRLRSPLQGVTTAADRSSRRSDARR
jgi:hypothetical protein